MKLIKRIRPPKYLLIPRYADNGNFSHNELINHDNGELITSECDEVEGVFFIRAKDEDTFHELKNKTMTLSKFSNGGFESFEEEDEGGRWKLILTREFREIYDVMFDVAILQQYPWFCFDSSLIMISGISILSDGEWHV